MSFFVVVVVSTSPSRRTSKDKKSHGSPRAFRQHLPQADLGRSVPLRPEGRGLGRRVERGGVDHVRRRIQGPLLGRRVSSFFFLEPLPLALHLPEALEALVLVPAVLRPLGLLFAPSGVAPLRLAARQLDREVLGTHPRVACRELVGVLEPEGRQVVERRLTLPRGDGRLRRGVGKRGGGGAGAAALLRVEVGADEGVEARDRLGDERRREQREQQRERGAEEAPGCHDDGEMSRVRLFPAVFLVCVCVVGGGRGASGGGHDADFVQSRGWTRSRSFLSIGRVVAKSMAGKKQQDDASLSLSSALGTAFSLH